jgi:tetratricopeptide (TPR) repeat protein
MSAYLTRAQLLRERGRHEEAISHTLSHLAHYPEDAQAFVELAINRMEVSGQLNQALADARTAGGLLPGEPFLLSLQSRILTRLDRHKEALELAESALSLDPESGHAWNAQALALIGLSRWTEAENAARTALSLDADDGAASNLLAHVLRVQNRLDESETESKRRLARDPENAFSFANSGWASLQRGDIKGAENYFKESLRIDPTLPYAKDGLKQSYRARSAFFRVFLKWNFWMQRFNENNRTAIIIGLLVGFKVLKTLAASVSPLLVIPLAVAYYLFVFGSWLSSGLANFLLLRDPMARLSLDPEEKVEGAVIGTLFFGGIIGLITGFGFEINAIGVAGAVMMATALPASMVFTNPSLKGRIVFSLISAAALLLGTVMTFDVATHPGRKILEGRAEECMPILILLVAGSSWLGMVPALRKKSME